MANASAADKKGALVVPPQGGAIATFDYGTDAGGGFEQITGKDLSIPFLNVLQAISPEVENNTVEGAKAGMIYNTVTGELIDGDVGIPFLPCHIDSVHVEWTPRAKGGGLVAMHEIGSEVVREATKRLVARTGKKFGKMEVNDNDLVETHYVYGLILNETGSDVESFACISFSSTKISPYKDWTTAMYMIKGKPPLFANRARIKTFQDKNTKGSFKNFQIIPLLGPTWKGSLINPGSEAHLIEAAKHFREMVQSGKAKADFTKAAPGATGDNGGDGPAPF